MARHDNPVMAARMVLFLLGLTAARAASATAVEPATPVPVTISWAMAERFGPGYDRNRDGRPDLPNSYEYVNPGCYEVRLAAGVDIAGASAADIACDWTVSRPDGTIVLRASGLRPIVRLAEGNYAASALVRLGDGRSGSARETIRVKDVLVVALGDSLATGEGNPEQPARWDEAPVDARGWFRGVRWVPVGFVGIGLLGLFPRCGGRGIGGHRARVRAGGSIRRTWIRVVVLAVCAGLAFQSYVGFGWALLGRCEPPRPALWADGGPGGDRPRVTPAGVLPAASVLHTRAHRSTRSAPAQFAMRLEAEDPHTSVTFVCVAGTGARTIDLFVPDRSGQNRALGPGPVLPAQFDELRAIVGSRRVDILVVSIGFNDCRSFEILGELIRREIRCVDPIRLLAAYPTRSDWAAAAAPDVEVRRRGITKDVELIYALDAMARSGLAAARSRLESLSRAIAEDPRLVRAQVFLLEYPDPTRDATGATGRAILDDLVPGLQINRHELDLTRERLLQPLNQMRREIAVREGWTYVGEIFAAFRSHGYTADDPWFIRARESEQLQGPRLWLVGYLRGDFAPGMLHPNLRGHQVIADQLYRCVVARGLRQHDGP
jgi:hypothetical protein